MPINFLCPYFTSWSEIIYDWPFYFRRCERCAKTCSSLGPVTRPPPPASSTVAQPTLGPRSSPPSTSVARRRNASVSSANWWMSRSTSHRRRSVGTTYLIHREVVYIGLLLLAHPVKGRHSGFSVSILLYHLHPPPSLLPLPCPSSLAASINLLILGLLRFLFPGNSIQDSSQYTHHLSSIHIHGSSTV